MKIVLSHHTEYRLYERGLDAWKVKTVVKSHTWQERQEDGSIKARKEIDGICIEVIYVEQGNTRIIKTAYLCK